MKTKTNEPMTSIQIFLELDEFEERMAVPSEPMARIVYHFSKDFMDNINYFSKEQNVETQSENSEFGHKFYKNKQMKTVDCLRQKNIRRKSDERKMKIKNMNFSEKKIVRFQDPQVNPLKDKNQRAKQQKNSKKQKTQIPLKQVKPIKYLKCYPKSSLLQIFQNLETPFYKYFQRKFNRRSSSVNLFHEYRIIKDLYLIENNLPVPTQRMFTVLSKLFLNIDNESSYQKAHNFLNKLLQKLDADFKSYERFKQKQSYLNIKRKSIVQQIFQGEVKIVCCCSKCNNVDVKINQFYTLNIPVKKDESIQSLFSKHFQQKIFVNNCIHCYSKQSIIHSLRKLPKILILNIESKQDILTIQPLQTLRISISKDRNVNYKLNALLGYSQKDFFYSIIQNSENLWNRFQNQKVRTIKKGNLIQNEDKTVFLFYLLEDQKQQSRLNI